MCRIIGFLIAYSYMQTTYFVHTPFPSFTLLALPSDSFLFSNRLPVTFMSSPSPTRCLRFCRWGKTWNLLSLGLFGLTWWSLVPPSFLQMTRLMFFRVLPPCQILLWAIYLLSIALLRTETYDSSFIDFFFLIHCIKLSVWISCTFKTQLYFASLAISFAISVGSTAWLQNSPTLGEYASGDCVVFSTLVSSLQEKVSSKTRRCSKSLAKFITGERKPPQGMRRVMAPSLWAQFHWNRRDVSRECHPGTLRFEWQ